MVRDDRFEGLRRRFLLIGLPIIALSGAFDWLWRWAAGSDLSWKPLAVYLLPLLLSLLLWQKRRSLRFVETAILLGVVATLLYLFGSILFQRKAEGLERFALFAPWFSVALAAIFFLFGPKRAPWFASLVYLIALGLGLTYIWAGRVRGESPLLTRPLVHLYIANAVFIFFLLYYARIREQVDRNRSLAHTDPLLGIANRRQLYTALREETRLAGLGSQPPIVIMFDLDWFKEINDTYGHAAGDQVLQAVANAVKQTLRATDRFGRWGGDEFIVLAAVGDLNQAHMLAQRIREAVHQRLGESGWRITISLGVSTYQAGDTVESWVRRADLALYRAKETGRNRVVVGS